jgi:hypothetical protein
MTEMLQDPSVTEPGDPGPEPVSYEDYWGVQETYKYFLPDGKQYFEVRPMDEGGKSMFQKMTNKGIRMNQRTQDATIDMDPADERHTLIKQSVVGWKIMQHGPDGSWSEFPCPPDESRRKNSLNTILEKFNPKAIQDLEFFIRQKNPWMQADMDVEEIEKEIDRLVQLKKDVTEQKAGEAGSANR